MSMPLRPLLFRPVYKDYLWGGEAISHRFARSGTPTPCAESWEVSAHPDGMSVVDGGVFDGRSLADLCDEYKRDLLGSYAPENNRFPLLVKLIDARKRLSVQVHPNDEGAAKYGGEAKTEMWYFIDAPEGSVVCAGLKQGVGPRIFKDALKDGQLTSVLCAVDVVPGKALYIPGGLVHAICEGSLVLEVQQNSNTTYRVYDWDRVDAEGRKRELHVDKAMEVINWKYPPAELVTPYSLPAGADGNLRERVVSSDYFTMERLTISQVEPRATDGTSFHIVFALDGDIQIEWQGESFVIPFGRSCLVPACLGSYSLKPCTSKATAIIAGL